MVDAWIILIRLNADLLALAARPIDMGWALLGAGAVWSSWTPSPQTTDLKALGLDHLPVSRGDLRSAYRRAAKTVHPDAGGSAEAFRAISEAFERLASTRGLMA